MSKFSRRDWLKQGAALAVGSTLLPSMSLLRAAEPSKTESPKPASTKPAYYGTELSYADAKFVDGPPPMQAKDSFTIAVLPDTQHYSERFPQNFLAQTSWIAENCQDRNMACVLHLGDITNHHTTPEWEAAQRTMNQLDGHVPYFMVLGNHDLGTVTLCDDRTTRFNEYFPRSKFEKTKEFGGTYDREPDRYENSYHLFEAGGRKFVVICLEYGPRNDVLRWANDVAVKHKDREAILTTHAYMYYDDTRYDWAQRGTDQHWNPRNSKLATGTNHDVNDGEQIWQKLVSKHENFIMTLNGHVLQDGLGYLTSKTPGGRDVHQVLVNFQMKPNGGDGWLRLMEFKADGTVETFDFSPIRKQCNMSAQNHRTMKLAGLA